MALTTFSDGDDYSRDENGRTKFPKSGYTPLKGDAVVIDTSVANGFDLAAADETPYGIVDWVASDSTYATIRELVPGTTALFPISGTVNKGDKIECTGSRGTIGTNGPNRSIVRADNSNGIGVVVSTGAETIAGTGHCVVRFGIN